MMIFSVVFLLIYLERSIGHHHHHHYRSHYSDGPFEYEPVYGRSVVWNTAKCVGQVVGALAQCSIMDVQRDKIRQLCAEVLEGRSDFPFEYTQESPKWLLPNLNVLSCIKNVAWGVTKKILIKLILGSGEDYRSFYGDEEDGGFEYGNYRAGSVIPGVWPIFKCIAKIKWMLMKGFIVGLPLNQIKSVCASAESPYYVGLSDVARCIKQMKKMVFEGIITLTIPMIKIEKICGDEGEEEEPGNYRTGLAIPGVWQIFTCIAKIKWMIFKGFIEGLPLNKVKRVCASTDSQKYIGLSDVARCIKQMKMMVLEGLITLTIPMIKIKKICKAQNGNEGGEEEPGGLGPEASYR